MQNKSKKIRYCMLLLEVATLAFVILLSANRPASAYAVVASRTIEAPATPQLATPVATATLPNASPIKDAGGEELFSPDQISGGLQTTITNIQWGRESDVASLDAGTATGWIDATVAISVRCVLKSGCHGISVMDYSLVYDKYTAVLIYGAQQEFERTDLLPNETTSGSVTFAVPTRARDFTLRYDPKPIAIAEFSK